YGPYILAVAEFLSSTSVGQVDTFSTGISFSLARMNNRFTGSSSDFCVQVARNSSVYLETASNSGRVTDNKRIDRLNRADGRLPASCALRALASTPDLMRSGVYTPR